MINNVNLGASFQRFVAPYLNPQYMTEQLLDIRQRLLSINPASVFAQAIIKGADSDLMACIEMIVSQAQDNRELVAEIVGEELLREIEAI